MHFFVNASFFWPKTTKMWQFDYFFTKKFAQFKKKVVSLRQCLTIFRCITEVFSTKL